MKQPCRISYVRRYIYIHIDMRENSGNDTVRGETEVYSDKLPVISI